MARCGALLHYPGQDLLKAAGCSTSPYLLIVGDCDVALWSLNSKERLRRSFKLPECPPNRDDRSVVVVRADYLLSPDLVQAIKTRPGVILTNDDGTTAVAVHTLNANVDSAIALAEKPVLPESSAELGAFDVLTPAELGTNYDSALRKRVNPYVMAYGSTPITVLEQQTFGGAYKGATDFVTKWCWPRPARWATRWAAAHRISPNTVTTMSLVLVVLATYLFANGYFLSAIPVAWAMTFLDTVDGKLARVTITSTNWGNIYDHGIDLIHPPFWWWAWYLGAIPVASAAITPALMPALWVILGGYLVGRLLEGLFVLAFKIETHIWRPIDYFFRTITARRNPNLAILTLFTLGGRPDLGFVCVAVWTVISIAFHCARLCQALVAQSRGVTVQSWLNPKH